MKRRVAGWAIGLLAGVAGAGACFAADVLTGSVEEVVAQQEEIQRDLKAGRGGWDNVRPEQQAEVLRNQKIVLDHLRGRSRLDELDQHQQTEVVNALEVVNAIATDAEDERMVCRRERPMGSNRIQRVCTTVGQMKRNREQSRQGMDQAAQLSRQPSQLNTRGGR